MDEVDFGLQALLIVLLTMARPSNPVYTLLLD